MTGYITVQTVQQSLDQSAGTADESSIADAILAVSQMVDGFCGRGQFGFEAQTSSTELGFTARGDFFLTIPEAVEVSAVSYLDGDTFTALSTGDWLPYSGSAERPNWNPQAGEHPTPYTGIMLTEDAPISHFPSGFAYGYVPYNRTMSQGLYPRRPKGRSEVTVKVTAKWGYSTTVPPAVRRATLIEVVRLFRREKGGYSQDLANTDRGIVEIVGELDPATKALLIRAGLVRYNRSGRAW